MGTKNTDQNVKNNYFQKASKSRQKSREFQAQTEGCRAGAQRRGRSTPPRAAAGRCLGHELGLGMGGCLWGASRQHPSFLLNSALRPMSPDLSTSSKH